MGQAAPEDIVEEMNRMREEMTRMDREQKANFLLDCINEGYLRYLLEQPVLNVDQCAQERDEVYQRYWELRNQAPVPIPTPMPRR